MGPPGPTDCDKYHIWGLGKNSGNRGETIAWGAYRGIGRGVIRRTHGHVGRGESPSGQLLSFDAGAAAGKPLRLLAISRTRQGQGGIRLWWVPHKCAGVSNLSLAGKSQA